MNNKKSTKTQVLMQSAIIAALYTVLTLVLAPISYGPIQFRLSEALCVLPVFTFSAIPGLTIGCLISNLIANTYPLDLVFGTAATLFAAVLTRIFRDVKVKNLPILSVSFPCVFNAIIIGLETAVSIIKDNTSEKFLTAFLTSAGTIAIGEIVCAGIVGLVFYKVIIKTKIDRWMI